MSAEERWPEPASVLGVPVHPVDYDQTLARIRGWLRPTTASAPVLRHICTVNPEFIMEARRNRQFHTVLQHTHLNVPDGVGVLWALRRQGIRLTARVTGADLIPRLAQVAAREGWRMFLLGAGPGVAERAAGRLRAANPDLRISGTFMGSPRERDWPAIQRQLRDHASDILLVAFGHPQQDLWIARHQTQLPVSIAIGVGGTFDFLAGDVRRAPLWMRRIGLEWLFRLLLQPSRWRRMSVLPWFALLALIHHRRGGKR